MTSLTQPNSAFRPSRMPLWFLLVLTVCCPVAASIIAIAQPDYAVGLTVLTLVALFSNLQSSQPSPAARTLRLCAAGLGLIALPLLLVSVYPTLVLPVEVYAETDVRLIVIITYLVVISAHFAGTTDLRLPAGIPIVPAVSVFGLVASRNLGAEVIDAFVIFMVAALGLLTYDSFLRHGDLGLLPQQEWPALARRQLGLVAGWGGGVALLSLMLWPVLTLLTPEFTLMSASTPVRMVLPRLTLPTYSSFVGPVELSGGNYEFSEVIWMRVKTPLPQTRWRGRALRHYNGQTWEPESKSHLVAAAREGDWWRVAETPRGARVIREEFQPLVHMPALIYASGNPSRVRCRQDVFINEIDGLPRVRMMMEREVAYVIESVMPSAPLDALRRAKNRAPAQIEHDYLDLPPRTQPLQSIAREVAAPEPTPYRKAEALTRYLTANCLYSLRSPVIPRDEDAATYFVTVSREGACDLFATALVVMCRAVKIPARLVTGFRDSGERAEGWAVVRERDSHAWAEIYVEPHGWVALDPTQQSMIEASTLQLLAQTLFSREVWSPAGSMRLLALGALALAGLVVLRHLARQQVRVRATRTSARAITLSYLAACRNLARRGLSRPPHLTPWEFERLIAANADCAAVHGDFGALTALSVRANFSPDRTGEAEEQRARALLNAIRKKK